MSNKNLFGQKNFPEWKGYHFNDEIAHFIHDMYHDVVGDEELSRLSKALYESHERENYFKKMLMYIQRKLYMDEHLGLCLNSAREELDIKIVPCEVLKEDGKEFTLEDYEDLEKYDKEK